VTSLATKLRCSFGPTCELAVGGFAIDLKDDGGRDAKLFGTSFQLISDQKPTEPILPRVSEQSELETLLLTMLNPKPVVPVPTVPPVMSTTDLVSLLRLVVSQQNK